MVYTKTSIKSIIEMNKLICFKNYKYAFLFALDTLTRNKLSIIRTIALL